MAHETRVEQFNDGALWQARCCCGWLGGLRWSKASAERDGERHAASIDEQGRKEHEHAVQID